jgi:hypothetical protein
VEFLVGRHLQEFGEDSLVARIWQWVLHGGGRGPISHMDYTHFDSDGPPSRATLAAEKPRQRTTTCIYPPPGTISTGPGSSAGCAPPSPKTSYH